MGVIFFYNRFLAQVYLRNLHKDLKEIYKVLVNGDLGLDFFMDYVEEFWLNRLPIIGLMVLYICFHFKLILTMTKKINHYRLILQNNSHILTVKLIIFIIEVRLIFHKDLLVDQQQMIEDRLTKEIYCFQQQLLI